MTKILSGSGFAGLPEQHSHHSKKTVVFQGLARRRKNHGKKAGETRNVALKNQVIHNLLRKNKKESTKKSEKGSLYKQI